jgi:vancomycin resistance protein YoaR
VRVADVVVRVARPRRRGRRVGILLLVAAGAAAWATALLAGRAVLHRGETMPGIQVFGEEVGGLAGAELGSRIRAITAERLREPVELAVRGESVRIEPKLLFTLERKATVAAALEAGRDSWRTRARALLSPVTAGPEVVPALAVRPAAAERLSELLGRFAVPAVPARVELDGLEPRVLPSRAGTRPNVQALLGALERRVAAGSGTVRVRFAPAAPEVGDGAARAAADEARLVLSGPVRLSFGGSAVGSLGPEQLAGLVTFRRVGARIAVLLDEELLARLLDPAVAPHERRAVNASFEVDGAAARVVPGQDGLGLDAAAAAVAVGTAAHEATGRTAALSLAPVPPELTTAEAEALGIRERVSSFTTEMGVSSSNRINNVHLMADHVDGTIVRPGETFSFNDRVGPRTAARGFLEGQMIVGSLLLPSIGGGVCQTATTLFNNAFELGLPILNRSNHSFYISHYPLGRDATVSWGGPDFVFRNDLEHALLIKSSYTDSTLTFTFFGTDPGRTVEARTGERTNWREPKLTYALDPAAPPGSVRLVRGSNQRGFDVTVHRIVREGATLVREDAFASSYIAVGPTQIYGPGRTIPGPYFVIPET